MKGDLLPGMIGFFPHEGQVWAHHSDVWGVLVVKIRDAATHKCLVLWDDEAQWRAGAVRDIEDDYLRRCARRVA